MQCVPRQSLGTRGFQNRQNLRVWALTVGCVSFTELRRESNRAEHIDQRPTAHNSRFFLREQCDVNENKLLTLASLGKLQPPSFPLLMGTQFILEGLQQFERAIDHVGFRCKRFCGSPSLPRGAGRFLSGQTVHNNPPWANQGRTPPHIYQKYLVKLLTHAPEELCWSLPVEAVTPKTAHSSGHNTIAICGFSSVQLPRFA